MAYVKNPNYNPNDPKSLRYIQTADPLQMSVPVNQSKVQNQSVKTPIQQTPKPLNTPTNVALPPMDFGSTGAKTSTPSNLPKPAVNTAPAQNMTPKPQMSVKPPASSSYTIKSGDSLSKIAAANGTSVSELMRLNPQIKNANLIIAGQNLNLPGKAPTTAIPNQTPVQQNMSVGVPLPQTQTTITPTAPTTPAPDQSGSTISNTPEGQNPPPAATGNEVTDKAMQDLAKQAGKAGMSLKDYLDVINSQGAPTKEQSDAIRNKLGIPDLVDDAYGKPKQTTIDMYKELYEMSDLKSIKESVKKLDEEIAQKRADLTTATGELLNNPWISQATRSGRLGNLQRIAMADIQNSLDQKQQYLDLYDKGVSEIESEIKRSVFDQDLDRELSVDKLNYLLTEAERDEKFVERTLQQRALRYVPDFLTGKAEGETGEGFTLGEGQARYDAKGNLIASRGKTQEGGEWQKVTYNGVDYEQNVVTGQLREPQVPVNQKVVDEANAIIDDKIKLLDEIENLSALDAVVGPNAFARWDLPFREGARNQVKGAVDQLISNETMNKLLELKRQGGTLGSITEKELEILQNAATRIKSWEDPNDPGHYIVSEKAFKEELNRLRDSANRLKESLNRSSQPQMRTIDDLYISSTPEQRQEIEKLLTEGYQPQEVLEALGFNGESQTSLNGGSEVQKIANAIGQFETGGNYTKRGPVVSSGRYKGERALGKYQIMPGNLPQWSKEALGRVVTEQEFMNSPAIQDAIAQFQMAKILRQHGTLENVVSVWFSGRPLSQAGNAKDDLGTTVPSYVKNVRSIYNNFG